MIGALIGNNFYGALPLTTNKQSSALTMKDRKVGRTQLGGQVKLYLYYVINYSVNFKFIRLNRV